MLQLGLLSFILFLSGGVHFLDPYAYVNAIPLFVPYKLELIYFTGFLEILFAVALLVKRARAKTLLVLSLYFSLLILIHLHVLVMGISFQGLSHPLAHVTALILQIFLILWTLKLRKA